MFSPIFVADTKIIFRYNFVALLNPTLSYYEWIMSSNEIETNDVTGFRLAEQGPSSGSVLDRGTLVAIMRILSLVREESGLAKRIRLLWSAIYWVSPRLEGIESVCWVCSWKRLCFGMRTKISWSGKYYP